MFSVGGVGGQRRNRYVTVSYIAPRVGCRKTRIGGASHQIHTYIRELYQ